MTLCFLALVMPSQSQGTFDSDQTCPPPEELDLKPESREEGSEEGMTQRLSPSIQVPALNLQILMSPHISAPAGFKGWGQGNCSDSLPVQAFLMAGQGGC